MKFFLIGENYNLIFRFKCKNIQKNYFKTETNKLNFYLINLLKRLVTEEIARDSK